ncbi:hypothetical protein QE357_002915 [Siphonobacter sp. BAB-5404]|nr:hypothetical protein [Siphonobacter sp. SORGH_AS_0500]
MHLGNFLYFNTRSYLDEMQEKPNHDTNKKITNEPVRLLELPISQ